MSVHAFIAPRSGIWEERPPQEVVVPEQLSAPTVKSIVFPATPLESMVFVSVADSVTESL